jgi:arsenate reductase
MQRIFYLASCSTCTRILKELQPGKKVELREIKSQSISAKELDELQKLSGSYESLFSRVAMKYRSLGLNNMVLTEEDYRKYILEEYTFLKRPVIQVGKKVFIGNAKANVAAAKEELDKNK